MVEFGGLHLNKSKNHCIAVHLDYDNEDFGKKCL